MGRFIISSKGDKECKHWSRKEYGLDALVGYDTRGPLEVEAQQKTVDEGGSPY